MTDAQWQDPTPCDEWCVRDLVAHVVNGNNRFAQAVGGESDQPREVEILDDLLEAYRHSVQNLLDAFRQPGVFERTVTVPLGSLPAGVALHLRITELLVHGWDLSRATHRDVVFPEDLAEEELAFSEKMLGQVPPDRRPFAPPQPVPDEASAIDRLASCLGRSIER